MSYLNLPTADDSYSDTRDFYDGLVPHLLIHDFEKWNIRDSDKREIFNKMCYTLELLDRGVVLPYQLIYWVVVFLKWYLNSKIIFDHWTNPHEVIKSYSLVLNKLIYLLAETLGDDIDERMSNYFFDHGTIMSEGFVSELGVELDDNAKNKIENLNCKY